MKIIPIIKILIRTHLLVVKINETTKTEKKEVRRGICVYNPNLLN